MYIIHANAKTSYRLKNIIVDNIILERTKY